MSRFLKVVLWVVFKRKINASFSLATECADSSKSLIKKEKKKSLFPDGGPYLVLADTTSGICLGRRENCHCVSGSFLCLC